MMYHRKIHFSRCAVLTALACVGFTSTIGAQPPLAPKEAPEFELPPPNGWDFLVQAIKARKGGPGGSPSNEKLAKDPAADLALQRAYVAANDETFRLLHESFRYAVRRPITDGVDSENGGLRELGRLLIQKSRVAVADGKMDDAADAALDIIQLGISSARGGSMIACLTGIAIESMGRGELRTLMPRLNLAQLREATKRLEELELSRVSFTEALSGETWVGLRLLQSMFQEESWDKMRAKAEDPRTPFVEGWTPEQFDQLRKLTDRQILINYLRVMDERIELSRLPFAEQPEPQKSTADALSSMVFDEAGSKRFRVPFERAATENRFLLLQLALHAFHAEANVYPDDLQALVPRYMNKVPLDPFDNGKPIRYRRDGNSYLLYSIGPDGVDDNGTAIDNKPPLIVEVNERTRRQILLGSKGDIVATAPK